MKRAVFPLWLLLVALAGCEDLWGSRHNIGPSADAGACTKDIDALTDLLVHPQACVASEQCPMGSFCNPATGVCDWQCYADSDCGGAGSCSCRGLCSAGVDGGAEPADPTCPRNEALLADPATRSRACVFDEDCPYGARCDATSRVCTLDCLTSADCGVGDTGPMTCDCFGRCAVTGVDPPPDTGDALVLEISPANLPVLLDVAGLWASRRVDVSLRAEDEDTAEASVSTRVRAIAGDGLEVSCDDGASYLPACDLSAWTFGPVGSIYRATRAVRARPTLAQARWSLTLSTQAVSNSPQLVNFAPPAPAAPDDLIGPTPKPREGEYDGTVRFVGSGATATAEASSPDGFAIAVRAWKTTVGLDIYDRLGALAGGKLRVPTSGTLTLGWLAPQDDVLTTGRLAARVTPGSETHHAATGRLSGTFVLQVSFSPDGASANTYLHFAYDLRYVDKSEACGACPADTTCDVVLGICTAGPALGTAAPWEYNEIAGGAEQSSWAGRLSQLAGVTAGASAFAGFPGLYVVPDVYDATLGVASASLNTHLQVVAGGRLNSSHGQDAGYNLCKDDFHAYFTWLDAQTITIGAVDVSIAGILPAAGGEAVCSTLYDNPPGTPMPVWKNQYVPCVSPTKYTFPYDAGRLGQITAGPQVATCDKLYQNYNATTPYPSLSAFVNAKCSLLTERLRVKAGSSPTSYDEYNLHLCPYKEALLGPLTGVAEAERYLCMDTDVPGALPLTSRRLSTSSSDVLFTSGDVACAGGVVPHGVDLLTHQDRIAVGDALPVGSGAMLGTCLADLTAEAPPLLVSSWSAATTMAAWTDAFAARTCFSPAHYFPAVGALASAMSPNPAVNAAGDPRQARFFARLVQQWVLLHSYLAKEGTESEGLARVIESGVELDPAELALAAHTPSIETLLAAEERGWNLLLTEEQGQKLFGIPAALLLSPDYRPAGAASEPHHEQTVALPVTMLDGLALHLDLVTRHLEDVGLSSYGACYAGGSSTERDEALTRAGRALAYAMTVHGMAASLVEGALSACTTPECPSWWARWEQARTQLQAAADRLARAAARLADCKNPIGFEEGELPLYFGDVSGPSARAFAASDYLLNGWAIPAVAGARSSFEQARQAWLERRDSEIQQALADDDAERRREGVAAQYGQRLIDLCGLSGVESKDALALFTSGALTVENCFIDQTNPVCLLDAAQVYAWVTEADVKFELCYWNRLGYFGAGEELGTMASNWESATLVTVDPMVGPVAVSAGGEDRSLEVFYFTANWLRALQGENAGQAALASCATETIFDGAQHSLPTPAHGEPHIAERAACYRGQLGESLLAIAGAQQDIEISVSQWTTAENLYRNKVDYCLEVQADYGDVVALTAAHERQIDEWTVAKREAEEEASFWSDFGWTLGKWAACAGIAVGSGGAGAACLGVLAVDVLTKGAAKDELRSADDYADAITNAEREYQETLTLRREEAAVKACWHEADQLKAGIDTPVKVIERAMIDADLAAGRFTDLSRQAAQAVHEGPAAVAREEARAVPGIAFHYWLDERVERFEKDFEWARRLTYFAMRAVEYEFQQSLPLRDEVLAARHPDQLEDAIRTMQQAQISRTINSRRPEEAGLVLSLRDEVLRLAPQFPTQAGERAWSPAVRFQHRLWSPEYAVYDREGAYLGQGIPFTLTESGALQHRCAERLWQMTATIQGDLLDVGAPAAPVFVVKRNLFQSQWCDGHGDGDVYQSGSLKPASSLFQEDRGGLEAAAVPYTTAMLYPWFNISRSDFYRVAYAEGASTELAGRGIYGDYLLIFPWDGLLDQGFALDQVEDVLLRFDYVSVDDLTGL